LPPDLVLDLARGEDAFHVGAVALVGDDIAVLVQGDLIAEELVPGPGVDTDDEIARFVRDNAWGHHASCSCPIGALDDPNAVVDRRFRVIGTEGLRIVDASVFPRIPGFFIALPIYMISEKAADVMIAEARQADAASGA